MSCMEHTCVRCGHMVFNNDPRSPGVCPKCGEMDWHRAWDEQYDNREDLETQKSSRFDEDTEEL